MGKYYMLQNFIDTEKICFRNFVKIAPADAASKHTCFPANFDSVVNMNLILLIYTRIIAVDGIPIKRNVLGVT